MRKTLALVALVSLLSGAAMAADPVVCTVTTATGAASSTASPSSGTCSWAAGSVILMQCTTDVYVDTSTVANVAPTASSADAFVDWTNNKDWFPIYLDSNDRVVSLLAVTTAGSCKFMTTKRKRPY